MLSRLLNLRHAALALLLATLAPLVPAQEIRIAVLDFQAVTERSTAIREMIARAEAPLAARKEQIETRMAELQQARTQLDARRSVLTGEQIRAEEQRIATLREEIQDLQYEINKSYERLDQEIMQPAVDRIMAIVEEVARRENYDLVLPSEMALYFSERVDLTAIVTQTLDQRGLGITGAAPAIPTESGQ